MQVSIALSTMWAQQERFRGNMTAFATIARDAGYSHLEVSHSTDEPGLRELLAQTVLPLSSLHAPTPGERTAGGRWNLDLDLGSQDEAERAAAVAATLRTIDYAGEAGVGSVVVHLGAAGASGVRGDSTLRRLYGTGKTAGLEVEAAHAEAREERARRAPTALAAATRSLEAIAAQARLRGVRIGIETRMWYHELPLPDEAVELLAPYDPALVGYWHDVGHAEILHRLGLVSKDEWFARLGDRVIGCHLHDVVGIVDHRAPGLGDVEWEYIARGVARASVRTLEINQHQPEESLASALSLLRREGVVPPALTPVV